MKVEYNYLPIEFSNTESIFREWEELIKSTDFTLGSYVDEFEKIFAGYVGARHCVSTNCGTDALVLSLKSLGIGPGDEVITVANTFYASVGAIVATGATAILVDCDERFQISVKAIERAINNKTRAIMPVHWAGASPNMGEIMLLANAAKIPVVEDACMGIGALVNGQKPGCFGNIGAFSMHPLKSLNVMGDGGMIVTDDDDLALWMLKYRNHGMVDRDHIDFWGVNMRLQPLQAIVAKHRLNFLEETITQRNKNASVLDNGLIKLSDKVKIPKRIDGDRETFALYMGLFESRNNLLEHLKKKGIETKIHYPVPLHKQKAAEKNCRVSGKMDNAEYQAERLLTIPVHQYLNSEHMEYIINCVYEFYN